MRRTAYSRLAERLQSALPKVRVVGPVGEPVGFCLVQGDELYQLYVSAASRGAGIAAILVADAETLLSAQAVETAWLACAIGNQRAARFYGNGAFSLEVWRYEKTLNQRPGHIARRGR